LSIIIIIIIISAAKQFEPWSGTPCPSLSPSLNLSTQPWTGNGHDDVQRHPTQVCALEINYVNFECVSCGSEAAISWLCCPTSWPTEARALEMGYAKFWVSLLIS
jgi:hypothetical protein